MARQQIAAQALGVLADDQATLAEQQLVLNATQSLSSGSWSGDEFAWIFKVAAQTGATGRWLDIWGKILGVPRTTGEEDAAYGQRILIEIAHASCANAGIAWSLDQILGTSGTQVLDAASFLSTVVRANNGQQANNGLQANSQGRFENTACCYVVRLTQEPTLYSVDDVEWIVRRLQAAGTRLVFVQNASGSNAITLSGPAYLTPGTQATITASCTEDNDYDWTWTVDGAAIVTGQGTNTLTILATKAGTVSVSVSHYLEAGSTATGGTTYLSTIRPLIVLGSTQAQPAGTSGLGAYVDSVENVTYKWTITNGVLESGQGTNSVAFSVGAADKDDGAQATLACVVTYYSEDIQVGVSTTVDILPYPRSLTFDAGTISGSATQTGSVEMCHEFSITKIATNVPARVRFYSTSAQRTADVGRAIGAALGEDNGMIAEVVTTTDGLEITFDPEAAGENGDITQSSTVYWTVDNPSTADADVTVTVSYRQEA